MNNFTKEQTCNAQRWQMFLQERGFKQHYEINTNHSFVQTMFNCNSNISYPKYKPNKHHGQLI